MSTQYDPHPNLTTNTPINNNNTTKPTLAPTDSNTVPTDAKPTWPTWATTKFREPSADENDALFGTGIYKHDATNDISYHQLLTRLFLQQDCSPRLNTYASPQSKYERKLLKPYIIPDGRKRTIVSNFTELCDSFNRPREHVVQYFCAELGTSGIFDQHGRLIVKGRFMCKSLQNTLNRYCKIYVACKKCGSNRTDMRRGERRTGIVECEECGMETTALAIRTGFVNMVPRRRKVEKPAEKEPEPEPVPEEQEPDREAAMKAVEEKCFTKPVVRSRL